ncbi:hypothetical protein NJC40_09900 [Pseudomonas sp. 21LCFQ02]|uniref:hypothetical protein n=1 Tax=unclassified Pseudomonas TaxID=196821 RepID=UPI0005ED66C2|nr:MULTISPECIES: hypothetical protein [unclassified Pseudomonas]MCO8160923.1 hypothetical protein [Pseudomonas sp. 21LCFQ010]MCO8168088.1 hypothetical protein [Pseudomonas sp. 21LCFQ02]MCQ9423328.1 hypothetical protein [Pseudomonas sp. LJDD11]
MKSAMYAALLTCSLVVISGCDQVESSGKQLLDTAANSAKQAIDDTHKAATKALEEAKDELSVIEPAPKPKAESEKNGQEI